MMSATQYLCDGNGKVCIQLLEGKESVGSVDGRSRLIALLLFGAQCKH